MCIPQILRSQERNKNKNKGSKASSIRERHQAATSSLPAGAGSTGPDAVVQEGIGDQRKRIKKRKSSLAEPGPSRAPLTAHFLRSFQKDVLGEAGDLPGERGQAVAHLPQGLAQPRAQPAQPRRHRGSEGSGPRSALPGGPSSRFPRAKGPPPPPFSSLQRVAAPVVGSAQLARQLLRQSRAHPPSSSGLAAPHGSSCLVPPWLSDSSRRIQPLPPQRPP